MTKQKDNYKIHTDLLGQYGMFHSKIQVELDGHSPHGSPEK
jgi:hypothetical protein